MGALFRQDFRVAIESPRLPREISIPFAPVAGAAMPWGKEPDERAFGCGAVLDDEGKPVFDKDGQLQLRCKERGTVVQPPIGCGATAQVDQGRRVAGRGQLAAQDFHPRRCRQANA